MAEASGGSVRLVDAYDLVILDLDGVVYLGREPVAGAAEAISALRADGIRYVFATNNAGREPARVADLLVSLGVPADADDVLTSAQAAGALLGDRLPAGSRVLVVGSQALAEEVRRQGLVPVDDASATPAAVVQGYDPGVGWSALAEASVAIRAGAQWVATNTDHTLPSPRGPLPGNGSLVAALATALGRGPDVVVGKPERVLFERATEITGAKRALVVGDRLDTDIEGAQRAGMDSLLVFTGVSQRADIVATGPVPTYIGADLSALFRAPEAFVPAAG